VPDEVENIWGKTSHLDMQTEEGSLKKRNQK
jgi:hypothetical protein